MGGGGECKTLWPSVSFCSSSASAKKFHFDAIPKMYWDKSV